MAAFKLEAAETVKVTGADDVGVGALLEQPAILIIRSRERIKTIRRFVLTIMYSSFYLRIVHIGIKDYYFGS
jgi:hypothetical protein